MPSDLTIGSLPPPTQDVLRTPGLTANRNFAELSQNAPAPAAVGTSAVPDNRVVLDPASDRVVLEYFDATGTLVNSLPSQRQLDAYRLAASIAATPAPPIKKA